MRLENQLCFPLYAASKEIVRHYKIFLDELDMTYTQYITMMVMWEHRELTVKELGEYLYLDSGTTSPVLKTLESKGWVERKRSETDERILNVILTPLGEKLQEKALSVPKNMAACVKLEPGEAAELYRILYKILNTL
ncbi:MAG: MarR family transcriptional regulator [Clostridia bacterium]|nr:MarR family transcriptional regulator [Clostridia bacterium]